MSDPWGLAEAFRECFFRDREDRGEGRLGRSGDLQANPVPTRFGPQEEGAAFDTPFVLARLYEGNRDFIRHVETLSAVAPKSCLVGGTEVHPVGKQWVRITEPQPR